MNSSQWKKEGFRTSAVATNLGQFGLEAPVVSGVGAAHSVAQEQRVVRPPSSKPFAFGAPPSAAQNECQETHPKSPSEEEEKQAPK